MFKALVMILLLGPSMALAGKSMFDLPQRVKPTAEEVEAKCIPQKAPGKISGYKCVTISEKSNFHKAGIRVGDIILSIDQVKLDKPDAAMKAFPTISGGTCKEIVVSRAGKEITLKPTFK